MKLFKYIAVVVFLLAAHKPVAAEFVIDDFTSAASTGFADTTRSAVTTSNVLNPFLFLNPGSLTVLGSAPNAFAEFTLNFANPGTLNINPSGWGYFSTIHLNDLTVVGNWVMTLTATNGSSPVGTLKTPIALNDGTSSAVFSLYDLDHASNLNNLQSLTFRFTNLTDNGGNRVLVLGSITAVPEPAAMLLLGLTAASGGFYRWRRARRT